MVLAKPTLALVAKTPATFQVGGTQVFSYLVPLGQ